MNMKIWKVLFPGDSKNVNKRKKRKKKKKSNQSAANTICTYSSIFGTILERKCKRKHYNSEALRWGPAVANAIVFV